MLLKYTNVNLTIDDRPLLSDINMEVEERQLIYITGEVGSGKSSLLKSIYGELPITDGSTDVLGVELNGIKARHLPRLRKQLGIIFQDFQLLADRTVDENLDFVLRATGWSNKTDRERRIIEVLEMVGLPDKTRHMPYELSGGEQQRICIARAILNHPKLLLADEPTANLDKENGRRVMELLNNIRQDGTSVIMTTHNDLWPVEFPGIVMKCEDGKLNIK